MMSRVMNRFSAVFFACLLSASLVYGQPGPPDDEGMRRGRGERRRPGRMLERVAEELELDEAQRKEFEEIRAAHRARMEEMAPHWEEIREAMRNGDQERAAELRSELDDERGPRGLLREAFDELEPILNDEQHERFMEMREGMERRREERQQFRRMVRELPDELGMDDSQRERYRELLESRRGRMRQRMEEMRPLFEEMREAEESGDLDRVEEIRSRLREARPSPENMQAELLDQVSELLREDQEKLLTDYYADLSFVSAEESPGPTDVLTVLRAARQIDLSGEQKSNLRTIGLKAMRDLRAVRSANKLSKLTDAERNAIKAAVAEGQSSISRELQQRREEAMAQLAASTKESILNMLNEEQAAEYERRLERYERRERRH